MFIRTHHYNRPFPFRLMAIYAMVLFGILAVAGQSDAGFATDMVDAAAAADNA